MDLNTILKIAALRRAVQEIAEATSPDLSLRQVLLLLEVGSRTGPVSQQELAEDQGIYKSTVSKIVANLSGSAGDVKRAGMGLLTVDLDPADMRSRLVSLSKEGERVLMRALKRGEAKG